MIPPTRAIREQRPVTNQIKAIPEIHIPRDPQSHTLGDAGK
jgi:hypothetical protein